MKLLEAIERLPSLNAKHTIYARHPWTPSSDAEVTPEEEGQLVPSELDCQGYRYFLEVFIARDFVADLTQIEPAYTPEQGCLRLIGYAENDA
jgi:hypothetical protein